MATSSAPLAGKPQIQDLESSPTPDTPPPKWDRGRFKKLLKWDSHTKEAVQWIVAWTVLVIVSFFTFVAIGRAIMAATAKDQPPDHPIPDASAEYIVSVLAGGIFVVLSVGAHYLFPPWRTAGKIFEKTWVQCAVIILASMFVGPGCVALCAKVLHVKYASLVISDLVVHFIIGLIVVVVVCVILALLFMAGGSV